MANITSILSDWFINKQLNRKASDIIINNEIRKNITRYGLSDIEGFIQRDPSDGSYIITGGQPQFRNKAVTAIVSSCNYQNIPVIILHEGNTDFQNQIEQSPAFATNKTVVNHNKAIYDPLYNKTSQEIYNLIINSAPSGYSIAAVGQQYISGVYEFIKSKSIPPFSDMFLNCPHDTLFDKIDDSLSQGYLTNQDAVKIRNLLIQGQSERYNIQTFFSDLARQGNGVLANQKNRAAASNIKKVAEHNGLIMLDIITSTNNILLNIIINEIKEVLATGKKIMVILDGISLSTNDKLNNLMKSLSARCLTTLVSDNVYAMFGSDENLFLAFVGKSSKCIVFSHALGISCTKWADVFGYYDTDKISQTLSYNKDQQRGYRRGTSKSISVSTSREHIVKPEEIARMNPNEVYILDRNAQELAHTTIK